ncbi:MAG TPA: hypothetical protein VMH24_01110, partial [Candidatus Sulfotelmatobacter sp.]|nr:hypothetical protein [Candidatus Sulfotelmatobacter sp.]
LPGVVDVESAPNDHDRFVPAGTAGMKVGARGLQPDHEHIATARDTGDDHRRTEIHWSWPAQQLQHQ